MTLKQFEHEFIAELSPLYDAQEARQLFYMTAEYVSGLSRAMIPLQAAQAVSVEQEGSYQNILRELKEGRPVQHIFAEAWFYGLKFMVSSSVLIPRPETEELVHWILESAATRKFSSFLDVGTGSGCIAITLKKKMPASHANALDVSRDALQVAQENASLNGTDINFIQIDILKYSSIDSYDLIVSNPPYITPKERLEMHRNVLAYEPELALFVTEEDPLIFYKSIADFALSHLETSGYLFFEINEYLGKEMIEMLEGKGFIDIELRKDMQGKDRMIRCQLK
ncbi:peptide chain release factor N(5)-glutamine methyltransferase [Pedobacter sp. MC2016-15]|uniref:peptide chain release factor N(5)-glutamine methyltransferase n=1 Tax=Pedobacter sp. MC2016-15 TaxID=2994473 RepID=UPI002247A777|nr:peptide chain release factor N(5)-glutamine methyltransferase [Pedobacter sp. MC2016-15]MCX2477502.1 peptide chain release factor N(5)-glutamine methyltransferase [Pedobacter sp. MC2016-15]